MKVVKYLFALWAGVLVYVLLSVVFGSTGFSAYRQLQEEEVKQAANIRELRQINNDLEITMNSLLYDRDTLGVYARELGYASRQERFIRIVGLGGTQRNRISAGEVIIAASPQYISDKILRIIAFCAGMTIFICFLTFDLMKFLRG